MVTAHRCQKLSYIVQNNKPMISLMLGNLLKTMEQQQQQQQR